VIFESAGCVADASSDHRRYLRREPVCLLTYVALGDVLPDTNVALRAGLRSAGARFV